jgi:hypothetical protein
LLGRFEFGVKVDLVYYYYLARRPLRNREGRCKIEPSLAQTGLMTSANCCVDCSCIKSSLGPIVGPGGKQPATSKSVDHALVDTDIDVTSHEAWRHRTRSAAARPHGRTPAGLAPRAATDAPMVLPATTESEPLLLMDGTGLMAAPASAPAPTLPMPADVGGTSGEDEDRQLGRQISESLPQLPAQRSPDQYTPRTAEAALFNPFMNRTPTISSCGWFKMVVLLPLALLRLVLCAALVLLCAPFGYLSLVCYNPGPDISLPAPLSCVRAALFFPMRVCARGVLFFLGFHWVRVKGELAPASQAPLLLPNHVGFAETFWFFAMYGVSQVSKAATENTPLLGSLSRGALNIFVRRRESDPGGPTAMNTSQAKAAIEARARNMGANNYPHVCSCNHPSCSRVRLRACATATSTPNSCNN